MSGNARSNKPLGVSMRELLHLDRYPIDRPDAPETIRLAERCRADLAAQGMFNLNGFVRAEAIERAVSEVEPLMEGASFRHARRHNVYFKKDIPGLAADHPALKLFETVNYTLCGDQLVGTVVDRIYEWPPLADFLACTMGKPSLFAMSDPLARVNV